MWRICLCVPVYYRRIKAAFVADEGKSVCLCMQRIDMVMKTGKESLCVSRASYEGSVCATRSEVFLVMKGNFWVWLCTRASKQEESLREKPRARQPGQCVRCCAEKVCARACVRRSSSQRFQSGSSALNWMKANVSGPTLWLNTNSIQNLFKHFREQRVKLSLWQRITSLRSDSWLFSPPIWTPTSCIEQRLRLPQDIIAFSQLCGKIIVQFFFFFFFFFSDAVHRSPQSVKD